MHAANLRREAVMIDAAHEARSPEPDAQLERPNESIRYFNNGIELMRPPTPPPRRHSYHQRATSSYSVHRPPLQSGPRFQYQSERRFRYSTADIHRSRKIPDVDRWHPCDEPGWLEDFAISLRRFRQRARADGAMCGTGGLVAGRPCTTAPPPPPAPARSIMLTNPRPSTSVSGSRRLLTM